MFEVRSKSPLDDEWLERDERIIEVAGRTSNFSGTDFCDRDHGWRCQTVEEARELKARLETVEDVTVTIREE